MSDATSLPDQPSLEYLRKLSKDRLAELRAVDPDTKLARAQLDVARQHGFSSWRALRAHVDESAARLTRFLDAAREGEVPAIRALLDQHGELLNARGGDGMRTALHFAAWNRKQSVVELLLERGADPNIRCQGDNATPLHFAAEGGDLEIVKLLVEHGADVNGFGDLHGVDVIGWATCFGSVHREVAQYLLAHGARHNGFSAVAMGDADALRRLAKVSRDVPDKPMAIWEERRRPLHLAVIKQQLRMIEVLLDLGADIEGEDLNGFTPLDVAALHDEQASVQVLLDHGATVKPPAALALNRRDAIERIFREDPDCLRPGHRYGDLIVHLAKSAPGHIIERMLELGASVDVRVDSRAFGTKGYTPLHEAAWHGNIEAIRVLVEHGTDIHACDKTYNAPPSGWADHNKQRKAAELLKSLEVESTERTIES